jgi:erythritol transport system ATP-binding protein
LSDRILVMSNGRVTAEFDADEASQDALVAASAIGHRSAHAHAHAAQAAAA